MNTRRVALTVASCSVCPVLSLASESAGACAKVANGIIRAAAVMAQVRLREGGGVFVGCMRLNVGVMSLW